MTQAANKKISFVIPVFNEASNIPLLYSELANAVDKLPYICEYIFVDDGSSDSSLQLIKDLATAHPEVFFIELSRNFGHQYALKAGLDISRGDCVITMDCDLQHPPEIIKKLVAKWEEGFDVVYTRRRDDKKLPRIKRASSSLFYKLLNRISDVKLENGTADFRLMSRNVLNAFSHLNETELFIRGLVKWAGFHQIAIDYDPGIRHAGESKYDFKKMLSFAFRGITSFSVKPLKLIGYLGMILFCISVILLPYTLISYFMGRAVSGWTSLMMVVVFFGSLQVLMIGIIGFYLGKLVIQSKQRPLYFIRETNYKSEKSTLN